MRHAFFFFFALLALSCSSVEDRAACSESSGCPAGQYCARTADGSVCWPDAQAPVVSSVTASCASTPCLRDGVLRVEAAASDDAELAGLDASLDLDAGARKVAMTREGERWVAELPLRDWPFEAFSRPVVASVVARDGARNERGGSAAAIEVTRLRWEREVVTSVALSAPAVMFGGAVVIGTAGGKLHFINDAGDPIRNAVMVGLAHHVGAPVIGADAIWVGSGDGKLYAVDLDGGSVSGGCATGESIQTTPVLLENGSRALVGSQASVVAIANTAGLCSLTATAAPVRATPAVLVSGEIIVASGSTLESFSLLANGALRPNWTGVHPAPAAPSLGGLVTAALAADNQAIWSITTIGHVQRTHSDAAVEVVTALGIGATGAAILSDGSAIASLDSAALRRMSLAGVPPWTESAPLNGVPTTPMVVSGPSTQLIVPTSTGRLFAVRESDGGIAWSVKLSAAGAALQPANIYTSPGQPAGAVMSTAYVSGADGKLYAVVVDGQLDSSAPWPKAFHDPRNTNNAGTQP